LEQEKTGAESEKMPTQDDYETARALALHALAERDLGRCAINGGLTLERVSGDEKRLPIPYLGRTYRLIVGGGKIAFEEESHPLKIADQVLLLHYLITATGPPIEDRWITFREVPSGFFYYPSFVKRAIAPLVRGFGQRPEVLERIGGAMGEVVSLPGDKALKIWALPRVPVVLSLWQGDEEFPPEGNVYFDASVSSYLPTEDIAYLAGAVVYQAIAMARKMG
jgi:hypothetical protein